MSRLEGLAGITGGRRWLLLLGKQAGAGCICCRCCPWATGQPTSEEKAWGDRWSTDSLSLCSASTPAAPAPSTAACAGAGAAAAAAASPPPPLAEDTTCKRIGRGTKCQHAEGTAHGTISLAVTCGRDATPNPFRRRQNPHRAGGVGRHLAAERLLPDIETLRRVLLPDCQQQGGRGWDSRPARVSGQQQPAGLPGRPAPDQALQHVGGVGVQQ